MKLAMFSSNENHNSTDEALNETKNNKLYRCAVYIRVSTDKEEQKSSIENQKELFVQLAKEKGWAIVDFYIDVESGTKDTKRYALKKLISDAKAKRFNLVVAKEISRLSRNGALSYTLRDTLLENKIDIVTEDGAINTIKDKKMELFGLYVWLAEQESNRTSSRIKAMFQTEANKGHFVGSNPPYGYSVINKKLIISKDATPNIVKRIYNEYLEGRGFDAIARGLYNDGIPTPAQVAKRKSSNDKWHGSSVRRILTNPHYTGMLLQLRDTKPSVTSKRLLKSQEETVMKENTHEAIIPLDVFMTVQNQIISRKRIRPQQEVHLFTNTMFCADCGRGMHFKKNRKGYICGNYNKHGIKACSEHFIKEDELADIILHDLKSHISTMNLNEYLKKCLNEKVNSAHLSTKNRLKKINSQIDQLNKKIISLTNQYLDDMDSENPTITKEVYKMTLENIKREINALETEKLNTENTIRNKANNDIDIENIKRELLDTLSFNELSPEMFHRFVSKVEIKADGSPKIFYRF